MITVVTPFQRKENLDLIASTLKGKCNWTVLIDSDIEFPDWVTVKKYEKPPKGICPSNWLFNEFINEGLDDETQYMVLCDDDSVEEGFFDKIPDKNIVITSMKRGERVPPNGVGYGWGDLKASPLNIGIGKIAGEQVIIKGKILKNYRYGLSSIGDGEMIIEMMKDHIATYVPDAYVLFNYYEDGRFDSFRRKPIVLFIGDLYCAANPQMGLSEWEGNLWASLEATGLVSIARFHMDKYFFTTGKRGDEALLKAVNQIKPDYVVLIIYKNPSSDPTVVSLDTIANLNSKLITIWGDLEAEEQRYLAKAIEPFCYKMIGTANKEVVESLGYTYLHVPKNPQIFNNPDKKRIFDIVFSGSYGYGREERQSVLKYLLDNQINLIHGGSEGRDHFSTEDYADRYKRAKISLSFSRARGMNVVNARPFEVMLCGSLLLEQESPELAKLYTPYTHYVPWTDEVDLLKKVRYYLENEEERKTIALAGQKRTEELYSAKTFWEQTLR